MIHQTKQSMSKEFYGIESAVGFQNKYLTSASGDEFYGRKSTNTTIEKHV